jgi:hypothetical protein
VLVIGRCVCVVFSILSVIAASIGNVNDDQKGDVCVCETRNLSESFAMNDNVIVIGSREQCLKDFTLNFRVRKRSGGDKSSTQCLELCNLPLPSHTLSLPSGHAAPRLLCYSTRAVGTIRTHSRIAENLLAGLQRCAELVSTAGASCSATSTASPALDISMSTSSSDADTSPEH